VIRVSAALVAVAIGVLIGGIATSKLLLVYIAIAVSAIALVALVTGVVLKREELFGEGQSLVPAAAGAGPGLPVRAGDSQSKVPSSGYAAPPPPAAGAAAGYGVPFGGVAQAPAAPSAGLTATRQGAARHGRPAEPAPPWESAATRESWTPDWMPAGKDQRAASGAGVRAPSAWQDTAATAPPRSWAAPPTVPVPSDAPAAEPDTGSGATTPSWFDRLGNPAGTDTPTAPSASVSSASVPSAAAPGSGSGWSWPSRDTGTPGVPVAQEEPAAPSAGSGDEDDDWPTRYSWLDDEPDQADASVDTGQAGQVAKDDKSGKTAAAEATVAASAVGPAAKSKSRAPASAKARDAATADQETAARATPAGETAEETPDAATGTPADAAGETSATVIAFRSRKEPEPEEPSPAGDADQEAGPAAETAETAETVETGAEPDAKAERDAEAEPDAEAAAQPEDEPATAPAAAGTTLVAVVRGVPRYHEPDCVLIRFMPEGDLQKLTVPQAKADGCTPCTACHPAG
jgi:hypothetical protein